MVWAQDAGEQKHLAPADIQILAQTAREAAHSFSLGTWCTSKNRNGLQQYAAAVAPWQQRNHWKALEDGPVKTELGPGEYDGLKAEALKEFNAQRSRRCFCVPGLRTCCGSRSIYQR